MKNIRNEQGNSVFYNEYKIELKEFSNKFSSRGTFVYLSGKRIIRHGDIFRIGQTEYKISINED
jgi:hypothetical protein